MNSNEENRAHSTEDEDDDDEVEVEYHYEEDESDEDEDDSEMREDDENEDEEEDEDEDEDEVHDEDDDDDFEDIEEDDEDEDGTTTINLTELFAGAGGHPSRLRQLVNMIHALQGGRPIDDDDLDDLPFHPHFRRSRTPSPIPEADREKGNELINSGEFGRVDSAYIPTKENSKKNVARKLWMRQLKPRSVNPLTIGETILPDNPGKVIDAYSDAAYSGQYSEDGSLFASCDREWKLRIYKTAGNRLIRERLIQGMPGRWTITDHNLSLDSNWLIYSSLTPVVYLTRTAADAPDTHHALDFQSGDEDHALWSVRFSGDGREIVAGGKNRIYVYDIESRTVLHSVLAHRDDVNSVCFSEPSSSQVVFSGSDDHLVKVWDRRSMGAGRYSTPSGILVGHAEGVTYVTSKGDNRYLASNGKDQKMLLWDLRMMYSKRDMDSLPKQKTTMFDYRTDRYRGHKSVKVPGDCSVMTFQGHKVLRTLIRCHFSPAHSTGQRYLYTGSADGKVAIYRLDGTLVRTLDTGAAFTKYTNATKPQQYVARDVSWHPYHPTILSSCMADRFSYSDVSGGIVRHSFTRLSDLESDQSESSEDVPPPPRQRRRFMY